MITKNEISSLNLSPTKKDFVQIWNELIEVASKITERWDPTSTNESDPGIVLLKVLTGIADKLNYNIDKNILEAYMPTAAQMESMRKLCELVGYDIKYYQSAETKVRISYTGNTTNSEDNDERLPETGLAIPKFTTITNADKDITFVTTNIIDALITNTTPWVEVPCIEGQISKCESTNENNLITLTQLDDNNRYYLPEVQIAENGIFVYNALTVINNSDTSSLVDGTPWTQVSNLNTQPSETRVFKFGYDSFEGRPYLAFPSDVGSLIGDGLFIYFTRTSGLSGNISPRTLEVLEIPAGADWADYSAEQFEVVNVDATTNGANIESISNAYNNFKRTIGTFDTLVTCRDYMNKIYSLMDMSNSPYVSNVLVTDIRNDINSAITLCSCNEFGILYKETPLTKTVPVPGKTSSYTISDLVGAPSELAIKSPEGRENDIIEPTGENNVFKLVLDSSDATEEEPLIDHFDLRLYPFKTFTQVSAGTKDLVTPYNKSFTYTEQMNSEIEAAIADFKTCAHNITTPIEGDLISINNYLRLNALIATSTRVSEAEAKAIITNVKVALINAFNLRNLDFGEEIPFDSILSVIENADSRIKVVSLQEPTVLTTYSVKELTSDGATSKEYGIAATSVDGKVLKVDGVNYKDDANADYITKKGETAKDIYNKLVLRNILAGRASLFDYDETFIPNNSEKPYTITDLIGIEDKNNNSTIPLPSTVTQELLEETKAAFNSTTPEVVLSVSGDNGGVLTLKKENQVYSLFETYTPEVAKQEIIDNVARIEAVCEINNTDSTFKNIELKKNEVIKFRAPNLITTKTFPAYVYYHFELGDSATEGSADGRFASAITLANFINQQTAHTFFEKLWGIAKIDFSNKDYTFEAMLEDPDNPKVTTTSKLANIFNAAIAVGTETKLQVLKKGATINTNTGKYDSDQYEEYQKDSEIKIITSASDFDKVLHEHFSKNGNTDLVKFKYYPLTYHTSSTWSACIKALDSSLPASGDLWQLSSTSSHPKGKLVMETGKKLTGLNGDSLALGSVGELVHICTDLGENPNYSVMPEGSSIELRSGDKLFIHYTPSSTNENGETENAEEVSIVYNGDDEEPIIVKPSGFTLMSSQAVHDNQNISWKKTDVEFIGYGKRNLLALAPNEQIELRSISKVVLSDSARFYKNFDNSQLEHGNINEVINYELKDGEYLFYTDKNTQEAAYYGSGSVITLDKGAFIPRAREKVEVSQILERGLHIIPWSDYVSLSKDKKITITEYQYETLVEGDTLNKLTLAPVDGKSEYTIGGSSWAKCLSTEDNPIIYTPAGAESSKTLPKIELLTGPSTSWEVCSFLELSTSPGYAQSLRLSVSEPEKNDISTYASATPETPTTKDKLTIKDKIKVYSDVGTGVESTFTIEPASVEDPISIKLSTIAQSASGNFKKTDSDPEDDIDDTKMQLKIFKEEPPILIELDTDDETITPISTKPYKPVDSSTTVLNNYWTTLEVDSTLRRANPDYTEDSLGIPKTLPNALKLNFMIPDSDMFGIFSIYVKAPENLIDNRSMLSTGSRIFIDIPPEFGPSQEVFSIFNYNKTSGGTSYSWWLDGIDSKKPNRLYLRAGLNCIKIAKSCSVLIKAEESAIGSILYDNMRLVKGKATNGVNLSLLNPDATFNTRAAHIAKIKETDPGNEEVCKFEADKVAYAKAILDKIADMDKKNNFYYNVPIENSLAIEFDKNISSFSDPHTLYDINNINNDFVISKLDVAYLKDGLKIAKSSKY